MKKRGRGLDALLGGIFGFFSTLGAVLVYIFFLSGLFPLWNLNSGHAVTFFLLTLMMMFLSVVAGAVSGFIYGLLLAKRVKKEVDLK